MTAPSGTDQQPIEEISILRQRIRELEQSEADLKRSVAEVRLLQNSAERLAEEMAAIGEIRRVISSTLDLKQVYERFDAEARKLIPYDRLLVNMRKTQEGHFTAVYISLLDNPGGELCLSEGTATGVVMETRSGILIQPEDAEEIRDLYPQSV